MLIYVVISQQTYILVVVVRHHVRHRAPRPHQIRIRCAFVVYDHSQ
jgi:hypothetical protein